MTWIAICWAVFFVPFAANHLRVRRARGGGPAVENRVRREPVSNYGLLLQFFALLVAAVFGSYERPRMLPVTIAVCLLSTAFGALAVRDLGRHWRIQAVVTDDHELITTGAYAVVRHPVYLALMGMLAGTLLTTGTAAVSAVALILYLCGTEIRVRAEDRLLRAAFPATFPAYADRVKAYIPAVR